MKKMKVSANNGIETAENNFFQQLFFRYWPYWPLFLILVILGAAAGFAYLRTTNPVYETSATILIKDEKKGMDDAKIMESLNPLSSKKIVENETEIIRSRNILTQVVKDLFLYAPVYEKNGILTKSAYTSSPVVVQLKEPDSLKATSHIGFTYSAADKTVIINGNNYPLNTWVSTPWGNCRFTENPLYKPSAVPGSFYFALIDVKGVAGNIAGLLEVIPVSKLSTVITLKLRDESPERGEAVLNSLMTVYNKVSLTDKAQTAATTLEFVENRLKVIQAELDSAESGIQRFRTQKGAVNLSEQSQLYLRSVGEIDQRASAMDVQLAALDQVEKYVQSKSNTPGIVPSSFGVQDPLLTDLIGKLYESEIMYEKQKKTTGENNPVTVSLQNEINKIKPNILEVIQNQRNSLQAGRNNLAGTMNKYSSMLRDVPKQERELAEMSRPLAIKNNIYSFLLQKREEAALSFGATVADSRLVDKASSTAIPVSPKKPVVILLSVFGAFVLGVIYLLLKEVLNSKILFRSDIEAYTTIPILGEVVYDNTKGPLIISGAGRTFGEEQFRQIRASINYVNNRGTSKKIMVTSSIAGEGKSFIASNLALSIAMSGKKVVLVDMDLYLPKVAGIFGFENDSKGVANYLTGSAEADSIIRKSAVSDNLFIITAGKSDNDVSELIVNGKGQGLINYLETIFDAVVIDSTPVLALTDAYTISSWCDATLYVVRHRVTPKIHIQRLDENAELHRLKNTGIIFNGVRKRGTGKYGYGYGYGYDYDYGYQYKEGPKKKRKVNA